MPKLNLGGSRRATYTDGAHSTVNPHNGRLSTWLFLFRDWLDDVQQFQTVRKMALLKYSKTQLVSRISFI